VRDFRAHLPRFTGDNLQANLRLVEALREVANTQGATVAQVAVAWVASRGEDIVPLVGARTRDRLEESLGALDLELTEADFTAIEAAVPVEAVAGTRYDAMQMSFLDSEK
jgi:aryl-alcohol dehydrogenase-like predicted oxidoreductase